MRKLQDGDKVARKKWSALLRKRKATGEPYIMFKGNVNKQNPEAYKKNSLKVFMTNICVTGDTIINIKIDDEIFSIAIDEVGELLKVEDKIYVLSKNLKTNNNEWKLITDCGMTSDSAEVYEIEDTETGKKIRCTGDHKLLTTRGWIEAKNLIESDKLIQN